MKTTYTTKIWGETYSITADFGEASCPVEGDMHGRQVADFRHSARSAMKALLEETCTMGGDDPSDCEDEIESALDSMVGRDLDLIEMADMLTRQGDRFSGNDADEQAQEWLDADFDTDSASEWCAIGVWSASVAAEFRDSGHSPNEILAAANRMIEDAGDDASDKYTDSSPIYAACNYDIDAQEIIDVCEVDA